METKHTPTPWVNIPQSNGSAMLAREYETGNQMNPKGLRLIGNILARGNSLSEDEANAEFIVRSCNVHDELVAALYEILEGTIDRSHLHVDAHLRRTKAQIGNIATRALAKARGES